MRRYLVPLLAAVTVAACAANPPPESPGPGVWQDVSAQLAMFRVPADEPALAEELGLATGNLTDSALAHLLTQRLTLPSRVALAILHLRPAPTRYSVWFGRSLSAELTQALAESTAAALAHTPRVGRAAVLPSFIVGEQRSVSALREAAARFQADVLLVYRPTCQVFERAPFIGRIEYRSSCTLEAVLLDVRSGLLPFAAVATRENLTQRQRGDHNEDAAVIRSQFAATLAALADVAGRAGAFLVTVAQSSP